MSQATRWRAGQRRVARAVAVGVLGVAGVLVTVGSGVQPAGAVSPTFTVTTTVDADNTGGTTCVIAGGGCSFRAAVEAASTAGGGTIDLGTNQTYTLTAALGTLNFGTNPGETYTVNGNGSTVTAAEPGSCTTTCFGVMSLDAPTVGDQTYVVNNLTVSGGEVDSIGGAGVLAGGTGDSYTFSGDTFTGNAIVAPVMGGEADGAGLSIGAAATISVTGCTFTSNTSASGANGGGLFLGALDGAALSASVTGSTFTGNSVANATGGGGGLYASAQLTASTFTVTGDTFTGNQATGGGGVADGGGGILVDGTGTLNAYSDNFLTNGVTGSGVGGAVNVVGGHASLAGDRFHANTAAAASGKTLGVNTANSPVVAAGDNWWSSNTGPAAADLSGLTVPTYLVLRVSASPSPVVSGATATVTADLTHDQADTAYTTHFIPDGTPVTFGGTAGTYPGGTSAVTTNGQATAGLTAGSGGNYTPSGVSATVDGVTAASALVVDQAPAITSATSVAFHTGTLGTFPVTTTGYPTPTLSDGGATLPANVTFVDNGNGTATLAGTPAAGTGGTYPFTITAHNGIGSDATQSFVLTVDEAPSITSPASTTFTVGTAGTFAVTTGHGFPAGTTVSDGGATLPANVTFVDNGNGTATLAGTPAAGTGGTYPFTITAHNGTTPDATQPFTLTVNEAPSITSPASTTFTVGTAGTFAVTTGHGFPAGTTVSDGGATLPANVTFVDNGNGTATLAGTPAAGTGGTYPFTITAHNGTTPNAVQDFVLTVDEAPSITSADAVTFNVGTAGTFTVTTHGYPTPALDDGGATLPTGVHFVDNGDGTGTLSGTPASGTEASYPVSFTAEANGSGPDATQSFTLTVTQAPAITSVDATTFTAGTAGTFTVTTATSFPVPALAESGALPSNVTFVDNGDGTATLAGTPAAGTGGTYPITITGSNGVLPNATQAFTLTVDEAPSITSADAVTFEVGINSDTTITTGHAYPTPTVSDGGATLPTNVTFVDNGNGTATLAGTPAAGTGGTYPFTITAGNGVAPNATQSFTLTVEEAPTITSADTTTFTVGITGTFTVTTGHEFPAATTLSDGGATLPGGVSFVDNGNGTATLSGRPSTTSGSPFAFTIAAGNGVAPDATQGFTLTVAPGSQAIHFTGPGIGTVLGGATLSATGGPSGQPVVFSVDASSGAGVCTTGGTNGATLTYTGVGTCVVDANQAGDADYHAASQVTQSITVGKIAQTIHVTSPATALVGDTVTLTATGGASGNPVNFAVVDASLGGAVCTSGGPHGATITFVGVGACVVNANQAGNADYAAAPQVTVTIASQGASLVGGTHLAALRDGSGYWVVGPTGGVTAFGTAVNYGSMTGHPLNAPIVGIAATPDGKGYWLVGSDGGVFGFGDAAFFGSAGGLRLNKPVVGIATTADGKGYWLVASDGGVFSYGDAAFHGSTGNLALNQPVVDMASTPDGRGYWLVATDGGVFAFGDAAFLGSTGGLRLVQPIVGIATTPDGRGYWLVATDGGVFSFGDSRYFGSLGGSQPPHNVIGMFANQAGTGYTLVDGNGTPTHFGAPAG